MKDTLREECEEGDDCLRNCCVSPYFAPLFFVVFVLMAQFVLVNVVVAVLMKHLEESHKQVMKNETVLLVYDGALITLIFISIILLCISIYFVTNLIQSAVRKAYIIDFSRFTFVHVVL